LKCGKCGAALNPGTDTCPACRADVELGRLTGILGMVCRSCDAYNEPGTRACTGCGASLGGSPPRPEPLAAAAPSAPTPAAPGAPVVRSFPKGGAATRMIPAAPLRRPGAPIPLAARCPRCGAEPAPGTSCARCGQALRSSGTLVMAPVAPPRPGNHGERTPGRARLTLERGDGEGKAFPLGPEPTKAGRSRGAVSFPDDPTLAPHHATFFYRSGSLHVRDEGAPGGIYLKVRGPSIALRPGEHLALGDRLLRFAGPLPPPGPPAPDGTRRLGAPRPTGPAIVLEEVLEGGVPGRVFVRSGPSVTIGGAGCAVDLGDPHLSQALAEIRVAAEGTAQLCDLGSSCGTFVRIPPHAERELRDADVVRIGRQSLRVEVAPEPG